jgi:hypothetical protein
LFALDQGRQRLRQTLADAVQGRIDAQKKSPATARKASSRGGS